MISSAGKILIILVVILLILFAIQTFGKQPRHHHRRRHDANGLIQPATNLQPSSGPQPMDLSKGAANLVNPNLLQATHMIADATQPQQQPCAADLLFEGCPTGQQFGGMTIMPQTIFPGSYLPPAVFNTSGFIPACVGGGIMNDTCFQ